MFIINKEKFSSKNGIDNLLKEIKFYLHENQLVLTNSKGVPLTEEEIENIISSNPSYKFDSISVSELETEIVNDMVDYIKRVEKNFSEISQSNNNEKIINSYIELINSMIEIVKVAEHFDIEFLTPEQINEITNKSISRIEKGDIEFIIDVMEYELIPMLFDFKENLLERQYH
ncbi:hypothetical protein SAMN05877753_106246 [Bacillus oleivorans]|uniref:Uncharacterized protein n=1 Tax=Bacillus oleivorans TaxID=1448271 RepID=A0A285CZ95_9BACI|nr:hypothetical protein [Bacillus oleivorans]SNX72907.1 hypothetical protein SAMN05877753_106246 [Bacillus oleivorans]